MSEIASSRLKLVEMPCCDTSEGDGGYFFESSQVRSPAAYWVPSRTNCNKAGLV